MDALTPALLERCGDILWGAVHRDIVDTRDYERMEEGEEITYLLSEVIE